jgi:hypothetical protein
MKTRVDASRLGAARVDERAAEFHKRAADFYERSAVTDLEQGRSRW